MKISALTIAAMLALSACAAPVARDHAPQITIPDAVTFKRETITLESSEGRRIPLRIEMADTAERRQQGLMNRRTLPDGTGMLFAFGAEQNLNFWMKNTLIPLDIIFFDAAGGFVSATSMVPCEADPCPFYASGQPAEWALEVPAGFIADEGVGEGWKFVME